MSLTPEKLRTNRKSYTVILQGIIREYDRDESILFFLIEGKDTAYYRPRIGAILADNNSIISFKNCDGKANIKSLSAAISGNVSLKNLRYLLCFDRDYEHDLADITSQMSFITCGYSVENYYTSWEAVSATVKSLFFSDSVHSEEDESCFSQIMETYATVQSAVHREIRLFNHWAWAQGFGIRNGKLSLDAFTLKDFIQIDFVSKTASSCYDLDALNSLAPTRDPITQAEIEVAKNWFEERNAQLHYRGKQEAEFLIEFLQWVADRAHNSEFPFTTKRKCSTRLSKKEFLSDLSPFAYTPARLAQYINQRKTCWTADEGQ